MRVTITFDTDNAAFQDGGIYYELRKILRDAERKIQEQLERPPCRCTHPESSDKLLDSNGNTVGTLEVKE